MNDKLEMKMLAERASSDLFSLTSMAESSKDMLLTMIADSDEWVLPNVWAPSEYGGYYWDENTEDDMKFLLSKLLDFPEKGGKWFSKDLLSSSPGFDENVPYFSVSVLYPLLGIEKKGTSRPEEQEVSRSPEVAPVVAERSSGESEGRQEGAGSSLSDVDPTWVPIGASWQPDAEKVASNVAASRSLEATKTYSPALPGMGGGRRSSSLEEDEVSES